MIARCSERRIACTHDAGVIVTDAAAKVMAQAKFPSNHSASCDCGESQGKMRPADCEHLHISDADGKKIASFDVREFGAARDSDQNIIVYRRPAATKDSARKLTLHGLNQIHERFYERGSEPW
ncbi:MAG TPA: hypothetical protein VJW96_00805 [Terriglobales bacterium]|nr:hypothetical protein [Terriglobales bacterium]